MTMMGLSSIASKLLLILWMLVLTPSSVATSNRQQQERRNLRSSSRNQRHRKLQESQGDTIPGSYIVVLSSAETAEHTGDDTSMVDRANALIQLATTGVEAADEGGAASINTDIHLDATYESAIMGFALSNCTQDEISRMLESDKVEYAEEDQLVYHAKKDKNAQHHQAQPHQPSGDLWGLSRIDAGNSVGGGNVNIYVIDSGLDESHSEFGGRAICGADVYGSRCNDVAGHGTHVAGTVGGTTYGVAKNANIIGVRVLGDDGVGSISKIISGMNWVVQQRSTTARGRPMVANLSIETKMSRSLNQAVTNAWNSGVTVVGAAGNDGEDACDYSPGSADGVISVASTNDNNERASFSNYGSCIDLFAPGENIWSADPGNSNKMRSGTSMSVPHVAGAAALYLEQNGNMSPDQVKKAILRDALSDKILNVGSGSPNLFLSVRSFTNNMPQSGPYYQGNYVGGNNMPQSGPYYQGNNVGGNIYFGGNNYYDNNGWLVESAKKAQNEMG